MKQKTTESNMEVGLDYITYATFLAKKTCAALGKTTEEAAKSLQQALAKNGGHTGGLYSMTMDDLLNHPDLLAQKAEGGWLQEIVTERLAAVLWLASELANLCRHNTNLFNLGWKLSRIATAIEHPSLRAQIILDMQSKRGKQAANVRHNKPGGARDKQKQIREIWATGKYSSRDVCAEQECAALEMSFSAARKALRNIPATT